MAPNSLRACWPRIVFCHVTSSSSVARSSRPSPRPSGRRSSMPGPSSTPTRPDCSTPRPIACSPHAWRLDAPMIWLAIEAPFAACRPMMAGWYRPTAGFLTHSAVYGLILNVAGVESRLGEHEAGHPGGVPASVTRNGLPSFRLALGIPDGADLPRVGTAFQQLHNYSVAAGNAGIKPELALGRKNNIAPVRRELLSDLRARRRRPGRGRLPRPHPPRLARRTQRPPLRPPVPGRQQLHARSPRQDRFGTSPVVRSCRLGEGRAAPCRDDPAHDVHRSLDSGRHAIGPFRPNRELLGDTAGVGLGAGGRSHGVRPLGGEPALRMTTTNSGPFRRMFRRLHNGP